VTSPMTSGDPERSKPPNRKWFDLSRLPEVNKFCTVRKAIYDFLLVTNSNFVAISHRLRDMSGQSPKIYWPPGEVRGVSTFPKKSPTVAGSSSILPPEFQKNRYIIKITQLFREFQDFADFQGKN